MTPPIGTKQVERNPYAPPQAPLEPPLGPLPIETCVQKYRQLQFLNKFKYFNLVAGALVGMGGLLGRKYALHLTDTPPPFIGHRPTPYKIREVVEYIERQAEGRYIYESTDILLYFLLPAVGLAELRRRWVVRNLSNEINQRCPDPNTLAFYSEVFALQEQMVVLQIVPKESPTDTPQEDTPQEAAQPTPKHSEFSSTLGAAVAGTFAMAGLAWVIGNDLLPPGASDDHMIAPLWHRAADAFQTAYRLSKPF